MTPKEIENAVREAQAFIKAANAVRDEYHVLGTHKFVTVGKNSGALRRQSMNLTRALSEMRKS